MIQSLNQQSQENHFQLKEKLKNVENKKGDLYHIQKKYLEAFEQNLVPVAILQERLQQIDKDKTLFEHERSERLSQLESFDTKNIQSEPVRSIGKIC